MPSTTLAQYRSAVGGKIGMTYSTSGDERDRIDNWVNEGYEQFLADTACYVQSGTVSLSENVADYAIDQANIMQVLEVFLVDDAGDRWDFLRVSPGEILQYRRASPDPMSPSRRYATMGANSLLIYPAPSDSESELTLYYVPRPSTMSTSSDTPSLVPYEYHKAIEYWSLAEAADWDDDATSQQGDRYRTRYLELVAAHRAKQQRSFGRKLSPAVVGRRGRNVWYREGQDTGR